MQGLITLDFGNSHPHAGLFQKEKDLWKLQSIVPFENLSSQLTKLGMNPTNSSLVLCEVKERDEELFPYLQQGFLLTRVKDYWRGQKFAGMPVQYAPTLGEDRLINAFTCYKKEKASKLIIDAGTFTTMDVVTIDGFLGGYILPGTESYKSSFRLGHQLKTLKLDPNLDFNLPQDSLSAINSSYSAFAALAKSLVSSQNIEKIIVTGGSGTLWESFFKQELPSVVVELEPHLIHFGLLKWMTTQIELS